MTELAPQYDPKNVETRLYEFWLKRGVFTPSQDGSRPRYVIIQPPPNVTGILHMGHALTGTLEDILIRRKRMQGFDALWLPGTDHAGIATQMVVEKQLARERKLTKHDIGREEFLKLVWAWKEQSQNTILGQMKVMGFGVDWTRLKFTLDPDVSLAVREAFFRLYQEGLIYRDEAIIQWCPRCRTALSDLEVKFQERPRKLWHIRYRNKKDPKRFLTVATTRPETLLGDTAVAVHPDDDRFKDWVGQTVLVPLLDREIPVLADSYVDKEFGTGALKITPGHDPNDYAVGKRHGLPILSIFDDQANLNQAAGPYAGLSREKGREKVLADLQAQGLLEKETDRVHSVGHCDRCATVVEPRVSAQWFVKAEALAKPAIEAVEKKTIRIVPEEWENTYFSWMRNIRPWCISRQLWWGHRIPVWYCDDCSKMTVAVQDPTQCLHCKSKVIRQDEDVLDTWFSSGLWPFSTLGWPADTADMKRFYPTDVMETGFDILFFWVARMIMLGMKMTGKIPFHTVYLHPMVRDEYGQKMSKTKGNVVDPLELVKTIGADSLRFFFCGNAFHGRDVRVSDAQLESSRNYVNKIWNAARFVLMHFGEMKQPTVDLENEINQWIWNELNETKEKVNAAFEQYRFFDAAGALYHFLWDTYCFWFIEFIKGEEELERRKKQADATPVLILEETLRLLHPVMPFLTEELWQKLGLRDAKIPSIALAAYPAADPKFSFPHAKRRVGRVCRVIEQIRTARGVANLNPATEIGASISPNGDPHALGETRAFSTLIKKLGKLHTLDFTEQEFPTATHTASILSDLKIFLPRKDLGDTGQEKARKTKELQEKTTALQRAKAKLENKTFISSAPEKVVDGVRRQCEELEREVKALQSYLTDLGA